MNSCACHDWEAAGELFQEAIGMIHIDYCPWCRSELYQREVPYIPQTPEPYTFGKGQDPFKGDILTTQEEPPNEPEAV